MKKTRLAAASVLVGFACLVAGLSASGCRPAQRRSSAPPATGQSAVQQARDKQAQQYILKRRESARKTRRTHTAH